MSQQQRERRRVEARRARQARQAREGEGCERGWDRRSVVGGRREDEVRSARLASQGDVREQDRPRDGHNQNDSALTQPNDDLGKQASTQTLDESGRAEKKRPRSRAGGTETRVEGRARATRRRGR
jgi:hypothetical protein